MSADDVSVFDGLTGLSNRRLFESALYGEVERAHRDARPLSLVLFDLDKFKRVNDELGHAKGDDVLRNFGQRLAETAGGRALACRIGGEEFAFVCPESSLEDAADLVKRLTSRLEVQPILPMRKVTASAGIAELNAGENADALLGRAERALYESKGGPPSDSPPAGVREPRRPKPSGGMAAIRKLLSE